MNPQSLYDLVRAEHQALVGRCSDALRRHPVVASRRRWWHALWRPPHARQRTVLPTVPAPMLVR